MHSRRALLVAVLWLFGSACQCQPVPGHDAGPGDSGKTDAGPVTDAGRADAGQADAGPSDAGKTDAGQGMDAGDGGGGAADAGDAGAGDGGSDAGFVFCDAYLGAVCGWYARCGQLDAPQAQDCAALLRWNCNQTQLDAVLDGGKISFAAAQAPVCLQKLTASSCARSFPGAAECNALTAPATPVGGSCTRQWSTFCVGSYCRGTACPAQCEAFLPLDAGCVADEGDQCGPSAYCPSPSAGRCTAYLAPGASCTQNDRCANGTCDTAQGRCLAWDSQGADAGCGSDSVCRSDLYCKAGGCAPREVTGGPCRLYGGSDCAPSFTCRISDGGTNGTCQAQAGADGGCFGLTTDCLPGLLCDSPSLLAPGACRPMGSEGAACSHALQNCKVGLLCDAVTQLCRRLPQLGQPCVRDPGNFRSSDCVGGYCPASDAGAICTAPQGTGAPCARPWECASTECAAGTCAALCTTF